MGSVTNLRNEKTAEYLHLIARFNNQSQIITFSRYKLKPQQKREFCSSDYVLIRLLRGGCNYKSFFAKGSYTKSSLHLLSPGHVVREEALEEGADILVYYFNSHFVNWIAEGLGSDHEKLLSGIRKITINKFIENDFQLLFTEAYLKSQPQFLKDICIGLFDCLIEAIEAQSHVRLLPKLSDELNKKCSQSLVSHLQAGRVPSAIWSREALQEYDPLINESVVRKAFQNELARQLILKNSSLDQLVDLLGYSSKTEFYSSFEDSWMCSPDAFAEAFKKSV